jgi:hypothetical protein
MKHVYWRFGENCCYRIHSIIIIIISLYNPMRAKASCFVQCEL